MCVRERERERGGMGVVVVVVGNLVQVKILKKSTKMHLTIGPLLCHYSETNLL